MNIAIIGAGVIGVSTAYLLGKNGHDVTVFDQRESFAKEASHANGAQLSYSYVEPFSNISTLSALPKYLLGLDPAIQLRMSLSPAFLSWGLRFIGNCLPHVTANNRQKRADLAAKSNQVFCDICHELPTMPSPTGKGKLVLISSEKELKFAHIAHERYRGLGLDARIINRNDALAIEPNLRTFEDPFVGAVYSASDMALDPTEYCKALVNAAQSLGVHFKFSEAISELIRRDGQITGLRTSSNDYQFDAVVICAGNEARKLLSPMGISAPIYPIRGYSLTLNAGPSAPKSSVTSVKHKVVFANLGSKIRIAGFTDSNIKTDKIQSRQNDLFELSRLIWPDVAKFDVDFSQWTNCRPMMPSGVPMIGESRIKNLFLNIGHGSLGYTFAAGSAMTIANEIGHSLKNYKTVPGGYKHAVS